MIKYFYYFIISLFLVLLQQGVLANLSFFSNLNLLLVVLVFITIVSGFNLGFIFAVFIGIFVYFFSFLPFGTFIIIYLIILVLIDFLYKQVLINFSFYTSLILIVLATILYNLLIALFSYFYFWAGIISLNINLDKIFLFNSLWQAVSNAFLMAVIFIIAKITIKKLNLMFLFKK